MFQMHSYFKDDALVTGYGWYADTHGQISTDSRVRIDSYQVTADFTPPPASGYATWSETAFPAEAIPEQREPAYDFDNDGLSNLLEYGLGSDPAAQVVEITGQKYLQIQWTRPDDRTDISTLGEISNDLAPPSWTSDPAEVLTTIAPAGEGLETVTIRDAEPLTAHTKRFLRARIQLNTP
jgi:hypothetical protein